MRSIVAFLGLAALTVLAGPAPGRSWAGEPPREFLQQYAPAVEKLRNFYTHATVFGTRKRELPQAGKSLEQQFVYRSAGAQVRLDVTTIANQGMGAKVGKSDMYMATGIGSLTTVRNPGSQVFDDARQLSYGDTRSRIESTCLLNYPYTFDSHATLYSFLQQPGVRAVQVKKIKRDDELLVKVSYSETAAREDRPTDWKSWFLLSPAEGWAIREYERSTGEGERMMTYRGTLTYEGAQDGVPLVKQIVTTQEQGPAHKCVVRESVMVSKIVPGDPAGHYFTAFDF